MEKETKVRLHEKSQLQGSLGNYILNIDLHRTSLQSLRDCETRATCLE